MNFLEKVIFPALVFLSCSSLMAEKVGSFDAQFPVFLKEWTVVDVPVPENATQNARCYIHN